nr:augmin complex subunit dgt3 [Helicoverpa armigera]
MNALSDMNDEEFVPFLHSLGADTYKKSFEWMLNDRDFAGVLRWLHSNLDHNNALTAREECRYIELEKKGQLLSADDLEASTRRLQEQHEGICLPGDKEAKDDVQMDIKMLQERLRMLEKQETVLADLKRRNKLTKEELSLEISKLNSSYLQWKDDESAAGQECLTLAQEVETITDGLLEVIADTLDMYSNCHCDKEKAKKFFTFGPFDTYRQSQTLFRSHFELFTSKRFSRRINDSSSDEELKAVLVEATSLEEKLSDAIEAYIESKVDLAGEQAKLALLANYKDVHPSQITSCLLEAQSELEILDQEETILYQQVHNAARQLVDTRTNLAVETVANCALAVRQQVHIDLSHLLDTCQRALSLDRVLYTALRHELKAVEEFLQLADQIKQYAVADGRAVLSRIDSMKAICAEQSTCEEKLQSSDILVQALLHILGAQSGDPSLIVKLYNETREQVKELQHSVEDECRRRENFAEKYKESCQLRTYLYDGCTRQPRRSDRAVSALTHTLKQHMQIIDNRVLDASNLFASVKNGDKHNLRKLWQWFLTDPARLLHALKNANCNI